jgi:carbon storage regulator
MLVLSRHRDESIMIGDDIVITIVDIRGDKVRLGIDAPPDVPVHRQEVYEAILRENLKQSYMLVGTNEKDPLRQQKLRKALPADLAREVIDKILTGRTVLKDVAPAAE